MKVLAFFSLTLAVATGYPVVKTWTLSTLSDAITTSKVDPAMMPYLHGALEEIMLALFTGKNGELIHAVVPSPSGGPSWTVEELTAALADPATTEDYRNALSGAMNYLQLKNATGNLLETVEVLIPALDISTWTQSDLNEALRSPSTKTALIPFLEKARKELTEALEKGETRETIYMITPVGLIPPKVDFQYLIKRMKNLIKKTRKGL